MIEPLTVIARIEQPLEAAEIRTVRAGAAPVTPCAVVGMPGYTWRSFGPGDDPSELTARVVLLAGAGESTAEELGAMLTAALPALDTDWCAVRRADPIVYNAAGGPLPAYELELVLDPEEDW